MADVLVLAASNGENLKLAERFAAAAQSQGSSAEVLDLTAVDLPLFTPRAQEQGPPAALAGLQQTLMDTPRWVICAPEYNGSIPPSLSNAIAWLSVTGEDFRALFNGRPIAMPPPSPKVAAWNCSCPYASSSPTSALRWLDVNC